MTSNRKLWFVGPGASAAGDLTQWAATHGCEVTFHRGEILQDPRWQLGPLARPALVVVDARSLPSSDPARRRIEEWLLLLRERIWESPIFLLLPANAPRDYCRWGRYGATGVLPQPTHAELDAALAPWFRKRDAAGLREDVRLLDILRQTCALLAVATSTPALWKSFLQAILKEFRAQSGSILLLSTDENGSLIPLAAIGLPPDIARRERLPIEGSITDRVIHEDRALLLHGNLKTLGIAAEERHARPVSALAVPLRIGERVIGSLNVARTGRARPFRRNDLVALEVVGTQVALALENFRLIEQVRENERLAVLGRTAAEISHCVKNIMTGFQGALFLVQQGHESNDTRMIRESITVLQRSVDRVNMMVGDLLDFSKVREPEPKPCLLSKIFADVEHQIAHRCNQMDVQLEIDLPADFPVLLHEEDRLFRSLMNLAGNALDVLSPEGVLQLTARWEPGPDQTSAHSKSSRKTRRSQTRTNRTSAAPPGDLGTPGTLTLSVADNGPGIPPEQRNKIFEEFYSTKGSRGTGLGLAMVRKFAEEWKGRIEVQDRPGGGSLFRLILPCHAILSDS
jgi:signal transduction histidine kinase